MHIASFCILPLTTLYMPLRKKFQLLDLNLQPFSHLLAHLSQSRLGKHVIAGHPRMKIAIF